MARVSIYSYAVPERPPLAPEGLSTLTSVVFADLSTARSRSDFAACLHQIHQRTDLSLTQLERAGRTRAQANGQFRELKRSTVSEALNGRPRVTKQLLECLLAAWSLPEAACMQVLYAWQRINSGAGQGPANAGRFKEASPRGLGIHAAITTDDELLARADAGDVVAADHLAELLADRGCLSELRERADRGHQFAAERLADFLVAQGQTPELRRRADGGDEAAPDSASAIPDELAALRVAADDGGEQEASQLTALLFESRLKDALLDEVNAGTYQAADRYLALLTADDRVDHRTIQRLRAFGMNADGSIFDPRELP